LYGWARKIFNTAEGRRRLNSSGIQLRVIDLARSSEEIVAFEASAGVCERAAQRSRLNMLWLWKRREPSSDIYHKGCQDCGDEIVSFGDEGARYPVQWMGGEDTP